MTKRKQQKKRKGQAGWQAKAKLRRIPELLHQAGENVRQRNYGQAVQLYEKILQIEPANLEALNFFAELAFQQEAYETAEEYLGQILNIDPANTSCKNNLAQVLCCLKKWDDAMRIAGSVLAEQDDNYFALSNMGIALKGAGEKEKSIEYFRRMLAVKPGAMLPLTVLCELYHSLGKKEALSSQLEEMERLYGSMDTVQEKTGLCFVLGRYYDYIDQYEDAFQWFARGNELKKQGFGHYDFAREASSIRESVRKIDADFMKEYAGCGVESSLPVFIIGMPRSGTTLVEQILAKHSEVTPGGELDFMRQAAAGFDWQAPRSSLHLLANRYLHLAATHIPDLEEAGRLTDKLPQNFIYAGLIRLAFPRAPIIHCRRDPMDTCFSCYKQDFTGHHEYSYDLETLGKYYLLYDEIMQYWQDFFPDSLLEVRYEDIVYDLEGQVRRMLDFCGLTWEEGCLDFHKSNRRVRTSSWDQVDKPLYDSSIGRWKKYEKYLQPLYGILRILYQ